MADAGISSDDPSEGELDAYYDQLMRLSSNSDRPVLLLLDDPLYQGSGWLGLLKRLARPLRLPCSQL
ncbi:MAG: hypothetical protein ACREBC_04235, partial [Pyrinomonadaceae bacterium]